MKVSLIMPTINVTKELDLFLQSLVQQTYQDFELIVVDQNPDRRVLDIVMKYEDKIEKGKSLVFLMMIVNISQIRLKK